MLISESLNNFADGFANFIEEFTGVRPEYEKVVTGESYPSGLAKMTKLMNDSAEALKIYKEKSKNEVILKPVSSGSVSIPYQAYEVTKDGTLKCRIDYSRKQYDLLSSLVLQPTYLSWEVKEAGKPVDGNAGYLTSVEADENDIEFMVEDS